MRLYFIYMEGCGACEMAKPDLAKFAKVVKAANIKIEE